MKLLCKIGIHRWHELGVMRSLVQYGVVSECLRCHRRLADYGYARMYADAPSEGWNDYIDNFDTTAAPEPQKGGRGE